MLEQVKSYVEKCGGWSLLTAACVCLLAGLEAGSFFANGLSAAYGRLLLLKSLPYLCVFMISATAYCCFPKVAERVLILLLAASMMYESVFGVLQLAGLKISSHYLYSLTGSFRNPGPYGGFIAVCLSVCIPVFVKYGQSLSKTDRLVGWFCAFAALTGFVVLPASMSRTAWAALFVVMFFYLCGRMSVRSWLRRHRGLAVAAAVLMVICGVCAFFVKKDSALGRLHIWQIELRAIADNPVTGSGPGTAMGAYGEAQAEFFESETRPASSVRLAGCPEYAFNEYFRCGMEVGVLGLTAALAAIVAAFFALRRKGSMLCWGVLAWGVFASASYPLSVPQLAVVISSLVGCAAVIGFRKPVESCSGADNSAAAPVPSVKIVGTLSSKLVVTFSAALLSSMALLCVWLAGYGKITAAEKQWKTEMKFSDITPPAKRAAALSSLYVSLCDNPSFLYDLGYSLFLSCEYDEAIPVLREGSRISSDPMFMNIIGRCYERLGNYDEAESSYVKSSMMVPSRLYPLVLLMDMCASIGDGAGAEAYARRVLSMPYDPENRNEVELRRRAENNGK